MTTVLIRRNAPTDSCRNLTVLMPRCTKTSFLITTHYIIMCSDNLQNAAFKGYSLVARVIADEHLIVVLHHLVRCLFSRGVRRLPSPVDSDHVYETIRQLQLDMAARGQTMRDRSDTGESGYLRPAAISSHPAGDVEAETRVDVQGAISTVTLHADPASTSPGELRRGGSEGSLAQTPSDDFVWM